MFSVRWPNFKTEKMLKTKGGDAKLRFVTAFTEDNLVLCDHSSQYSIRFFSVKFVFTLCEPTHFEHLMFWEEICL